MGEASQSVTRHRLGEMAEGVAAAGVVVFAVGVLLAIRWVETW